MKVKMIDGLPVIDAKRPLTLEVLPADIAKADTKHPESCAAARACVRGLKVLEARVHLGRVYLRQNKNNWVRYSTPKHLRDEIIAFDRGGTFEPGVFELGVPALKGHSGSKSKNIKDKNRKHQIRQITVGVRNGPANSDS